MIFICTPFFCLLHDAVGDAFDKPPCRGCSSYLMEPYIKCAECGPPEFLLCLQVNILQCLDHIDVLGGLAAGVYYMEILRQPEMIHCSAYV